MNTQLELFTIKTIPSTAHKYNGPFQFIVNGGIYVKKSLGCRTDVSLTDITVSYDKTPTSLFCIAVSRIDITLLIADTR